jgi:DNA-binding NarL/FixJ family response regulator
MDVILIDFKEIHQSNLGALQKFRTQLPQVKVIVFTNSTEKSLIIQAIELGVQGFQLKHADPTEIIKSIHTVYQGGKSMSSCVTNALLEHTQDRMSQVKSELSRREQEVLELIARGKTNDKIAKSLYISTRTVKFHVSSIFLKLKVKNRTEAALLVRSESTFSANDALPVLQYM